VKLLFNDSNQHVGGHGAPDLRLHGVLARSQKSFDTQVLFDPLEEQFHLPATLVQSGDGQRRQRRIVGQEHESLARFWILVSNAPQMFGIIFRDVKSLEANRLIADDASGSVSFARIHAPGIHAPFGAGDKECARLMHLEEPTKIQITPIHHVKRARFDRQNIEHFDIAHLAIADVDKGGNGSAQVQQRMHLHSRLGAAKRCPVEQAQAQVDGGRVQRIDCRVKFQTRRFRGIKVACSNDQSHRQIVVDAPVSLIQRVRERRSGRNAAQAHVVQLGLVGCQARLDVAQRFSPGQLCKSHNAEQIGAPQGAHARVAVVSVDDAPECFPRHTLHHLRKQGFAHVHVSPRFFQNRNDRKPSI